MASRGVSAARSAWQRRARWEHWARARRRSSVSERLMSNSIAIFCSRRKCSHSRLQARTMSVRRVTGCSVQDLLKHAEFAFLDTTKGGISRGGLNFRHFILFIRVHTNVYSYTYVHLCCECVGECARERERESKREREREPANAIEL